MKLKELIIMAVDQDLHGESIPMGRPLGQYLKTHLPALAAAARDSEFTEGFLVGFLVGTELFHKHGPADDLGDIIEGRVP